MKIRKPSYYDQFHCIASRCPDSCCQGWEVEVDDASARRYLALPGALGEDLRRAIRRGESGYWMENTQGRCPMWRGDGLCRIQAELGEAALCCTCREFPRLRHDYGPFLELGLELSCPEAARLILTAPRGPDCATETPEPGEAAQDPDALALLLRSREEVLLLLEKYPVPQALTILLLYGCHIQGQLDGGEAVPFDPEAALETAAAMAVPGDPAGLLPFFRGLEILTDRWRELLSHTQPSPWHQGFRPLARYFIERYWLQAVSDYDLYSRVKLVILSCLVIRTLGGDFMSTAQCYSKELENDADNLDALLDAAYREPAFTDAQLLGMLQSYAP